MWAVVTRSDPERSLDIINRAWSGPLDPAIEPDLKGHNSRMIIDATRPWEWRDKFPIAIGPHAQTKRETRKKWGPPLAAQPARGKGARLASRGSPATRTKTGPRRKGAPVPG